MPCLVGGEGGNGLPQWSEAPRLQAGASRKGNIVLVVPLDPAYKAGLAGHLPVKTDPVSISTFPGSPSRVCPVLTGWAGSFISEVLYPIYKQEKIWYERQKFSLS
jgi:hypothetical protein